MLPVECVCFQGRGVPHVTINHDAPASVYRVPDPGPTHPWTCSNLFNLDFAVQGPPPPGHV